MNSRISLPATIVAKDGHAFTEKFSTDFSEFLYFPLLRELAVALFALSGKNKGTIAHAHRVLYEFCQYISDNTQNFPIKTLSDLTQDFIHAYVVYLKRKYKKEKTWFRKYKLLRARLKQFVNEDIFPYIIAPSDSPVEGHTPFAMKMILKACHSEIDRIRNMLETTPQGETISKWKAASQRGRVLDANWLERMTPGTTSSLTEDQLDEFEKILDKKNFRAPDKEIAKRYGLSTKSVSDLRQALNKGILPQNRSRFWTLPPAEKVKIKSDLLAPTRPSMLEFAKREGLSVATLYSLSDDWRNGGRTINKRSGRRNKGRPRGKFSKDDIDLTLDDIVATINHYIPDWPSVGRQDSSKQARSVNRVYEYKRGPLINTYSSKKEATEAAKAIGGVCFSGYPKVSEMNPAEMLIVYRNRVGMVLKEKLTDLLPNNIEKDLFKAYFPTSYDWTVIYLYWIALTGWNKEAVKSTDTLQLKRILKHRSPEDILSNEHSTFSVTVIPDSNDEEMEKKLAALTGLKRRSQPSDKPKLYTHISSINERYSLVRILADYYELTKPLRKHLQGDQDNCILVGYAQRVVHQGEPFTMFGNSRSSKFDPNGNIPIFFERNAVFEEEGECSRILTTSAQRLRSTYFSTLQHIGIPIHTQMFLGRHESIDTTLLSYAGDMSSLAIIRQEARKCLNILADKAFKGTLKRYFLVDKTNSNTRVVQIITHCEREKEIDIMACKNRWKPTWEGNKKHLKRNDKGCIIEPCISFEMCLFCEQCLILRDSLPHLVQWDKDIRNWCDKQDVGFSDVPAFFYRRLQAIKEIFDLCEKDDEGWREALRDAEYRAEDPSFISPPLWGYI